MFLKIVCQKVQGKLLSLNAEPTEKKNWPDSKNSWLENIKKRPRSIVLIEIYFSFFEYHIFFS